MEEQELKNVIAKAGYDAVSVSSELYEMKIGIMKMAKCTIIRKKYMRRMMKCTKKRIFYLQKSIFSIIMKI